MTKTTRAQTPEVQENPEKQFDCIKKKTVLICVHLSNLPFQ